MRKKRLWGVRDIVEPLLALPFGFVGIYWFENGFTTVTAISCIVLLFVFVPFVVVAWKKL